MQKQECPVTVKATQEQDKAEIALVNPTTHIVANDALLVKCNLDNTPMSRKPDKSEYGKMRYRMFPKELDARRLFNGVLNGYAFTPAVLDGTGGDSWREQRLFAVDIDNHADDENPLTLEQAREKMEANGVKPLFGYYTFSHTDAVPRFRLVFATDETVTNKVDAEHITAALQSLFPNADGAAVDAARVFLGTNKGAAIPYTGETNSVSHLLELYHARVEPQQTAIPYARTVKPVSDSALAQAIEEFNMCEYVATSEGIQGKFRQGRYMFNPCPICGHKDDFYIKDNVWYCFGASNQTGTKGGNIINYLEARHGWTREQAREYFMYDVLKWDRTETRKQTREFERVKRAERAVGAAAITNKDERPDFILVKKKRDMATGELVDVETVSCPRLAQYIREHEHFRFVENPGNEGTLNYWYENGYYKNVGERRIKGRIKAPIKAWNPDLLKMRDVDEVYKDISTDDEKFYGVNERNPEELVVNFQNGLFYPMTNELKPHTPDLFTTRQFPIDYPLDALEMDLKTLCTMCPTFHKYMSRFCYGARRDIPGGEKRYRSLMEYMSAIMSNIKSRRIKKSYWIYGEGNSGKSQLLAFLKILLGDDNAYPTDLKHLESRFGAAPIFNKRLVYCPDQKYINIDELSFFKQIVGAGDSIRVEPKGKEPFGFEFDGFLWVCANKLPKFGGDTGTHIYDRMILFKAPETIPEKERDSELLDKLEAEAPYIAAYILRYLHCVVESGYKITEPLETAQARKAYAFQNEPVRQWLAECCIKVDSPENEEEADTVEAWKRNTRKPCVKCLYKVYEEWCRQYENGFKLKWNDWKDKLKEILGCPDMLDSPDDEQPNKPALYMARQKTGKVIAHWCLNAEALNEYSSWIDK